MSFMTAMFEDATTGKVTERYNVRVGSTRAQFLVY